MLPPRSVVRAGLAMAEQAGAAGHRDVLRGCRGQVRRIQAQQLVTTAARAVDEVCFRGFRSVEVREPVFIVAPPRSGTSLLYGLLAGDPSFTCMKTYQSQLPAISLERCFRFLGWLDRPLRGRLARVVDRLDAQTARMEHIHRTRLREPEEDSGLFLAALVEPNINMVFPFGHAMAHRWYLDDIAEPERSRIMAWYVGSLRRHLYDAPGKRLLVKNTHLAGRLEATRDAFPDLKVINIVRHPYQTVPSSVSLVGHGYRMLTGVTADLSRPEWRAIADATIEYYRRLHRLEPTFPAEQWVTVRFDELVREPQATAERVYDQLGLSLSPQARAGIEREASASSRHRSSGHDYALADFGLTRAAIHEPLSEIFDTYGFDR